MSTPWIQWSKRVVPLSVRQALRLRFGWRWFVGDFASWAEAASRTTGYGDPSILARVRVATQDVREERAQFERDGVAFANAVPEPDLLDCFSRIAGGTTMRPVRVVDFGGSLGSTWWRHRDALRRLGAWQWCVVEQPSFVDLGRAEAQTDELRFFHSIEEVLQAGAVDVMFSSTTLQYLAEPHAWLRRYAGAGIPWILLNNVPLHTSAADRIAIQRVPPSLGAASYPVWFFNRARLLAELESAYALEREFASEAVWPVDRAWYPSTGLLMRRKGVSP